MVGKRSKGVSDFVERVWVCEKRSRGLRDDEAGFAWERVAEEEGIGMADCTSMIHGRSLATL